MNKLSEHRYILEPFKGMSSRYLCPECRQKDKTFVRYIDTEKVEHMHPSVGRCNRENNCGYHYTPKQYFQDNKCSLDRTIIRHPKSKLVKQPEKQSSFIPVELFKASLKNYESNHFINYLVFLFGIETSNELIEKYFIGTSKHWKGSTIFWQIDIHGKTRTGKIMLYNSYTGNRIKEPFNHINWVHKVLKLTEFELKQCFFGEHLLLDKKKPVAIVESEKTAVIASIYFPQFIWLATGGKNGCRWTTPGVIKILKNRKVFLFPDLSNQGAKENCFEKWSNKAKEISHLANFTVSDLLERKATKAEKKQGFDIADYLIRFNPEQFIIENRGVIESVSQKSDKLINNSNTDKKTIDELKLNEIPINEFGYPVLWDKTIETEKIPSILDQFISKNPNLQTLIASLELMQIN